VSKRAVLLIAGACTALTAEEYLSSPEAKRTDGVPQGKLTQQVFKDSDIFPGTERDYQVYIPAQYTEAEPACLMVFQDGHAYINPNRGTRAPTVFDNLIHAGEMPVPSASSLTPR
jgi:enterochelin esterase-like enzyme